MLARKARLKRRNAGDLTAYVCRSIEKQLRLRGFVTRQLEDDNVAWLWLGAEDPTLEGDDAKVDGKVLTVETLPFESQLDGVDVVAIVEYEKE